MKDVRGDFVFCVKKRAATRAVIVFGCVKRDFFSARLSCQYDAMTAV